MITLAHNTKIAIQVIIQDDTGRVAELLAVLNILAALLVQMGRLVLDVAGVVVDIVDAAGFAYQVSVIGFKALAYGFGVSV